MWLKGLRVLQTCADHYLPAMFLIFILTLKKLFGSATHTSGRSDAVDVEPKAHNPAQSEDRKFCER